MALKTVSSLRPGEVFRYGPEDGGTVWHYLGKTTELVTNMGRKYRKTENQTTVQIHQAKRLLPYFNRPYLFAGSDQVNTIELCKVCLDLLESALALGPCDCCFPEVKGGLS